MEHERLGILLTKENEEFYIIKYVGEGATSFVYLALGKDNKEYAIKLYINETAYKNETARLREIIPSKNIVKLFSSGEGIIQKGSSKDSYLLCNHFGNEPVNYGIFEYLNNGELNDYVFTIKKRFNEDISRKIFYEIVKGLEACHKSGISHGDIKLENVLLSLDFSIKLIDFGFAKKIENGVISDSCGTDFYVAPECRFISKRNGYYGVPADIFSLGVVLFVLVMGFYPFDHPNIFDKQYKLLIKKDYGNFWKRCEKNIILDNCTISNDFKNLFQKMVCCDPKDRLSLDEIKKHPWLLELTKLYPNNDGIDFSSANIVSNSDISELKELEVKYMKELKNRKIEVDQKK